MEPMVSILLPTYNRPLFFTQALLSAVNQTYANIEIIICDIVLTMKQKKICEALLNLRPVRYLKPG